MPRVVVLRSTDDHMSHTCSRQGAKVPVKTIFSLATNPGMVGCRKDCALKSRGDNGPMVALLSVFGFLYLEGLPLFESTLQGRLHLHFT
jgi:hypothetical protein